MATIEGRQGRQRSDRSGHAVKSPGRTPPDQPQGRPVARRQPSRPDDGNAFLRDPGEGPAWSDDVLAEAMGEGFLRSVTSGEDLGEEMGDEVTPEEIGGPFVDAGAEQFAGGTDESNPEDAEREPLPKPTADLIQFPRLDQDE